MKDDDGSAVADRENVNIMGGIDQYRFLLDDIVWGGRL